MTFSDCNYEDRTRGKEVFASSGLPNCISVLLFFLTLLFFPYQEWKYSHQKIASTSVTGIGSKSG